MGPHPTGASHGRRLRLFAAPAALALGCGIALVCTTPAHATTPRTIRVDADHVVNPFEGATFFDNPDYTKEVDAGAATVSGTLAQQEQTVASYSTGIWMDHIGAITGGSNNNGRLGLTAELNDAEAQAASSSTPIMVPVVIYDLPGRDCAALASNGELPATQAGLTEYESEFIDPIAAIEGSSTYSNLRIVNIIEPDSLPNAVTNQSLAACQTATPFYEQGIEYALNQLHPISWTYNYLDIAHSAWLGWPSNLGPAAQLYAQVAQATTAGFASIDGFISDTANYTPTKEPYLTATETVGGQQVDSDNFYQYDPYIDELDYDQAMYQALVSDGFASSVGILIDTSRDGWGGADRPTGPSTSTDLTTFVDQSKIDQRPFRGDWCNQANAGIGATPQADPVSSFDNLYAYLWVKPPGESDGTYPDSTAGNGKGDEHCDPGSTNTDGNGNTYPTGSLANPPPAGQWFQTEFDQLVTDAYPPITAAAPNDDHRR